jgi:hypothetical protein
MNLITDALYTFSSDRQIAFYDKKIGLINRFIQVCLFSFIMYDLFDKQLYYKTEIPSGYTTMWAESNDLYNIQTNATLKTPEFCDNPEHNYIYSLPYWNYCNNSCINLHYSEMYEKGENEIFFQTYFTENKIILQDCNHFNYSANECQIIDRLDGQCFCQNYRNFYSVGVEGMQLVFNHLYTTSFESGSNIKSNGDIKPIKTIIKNVNGKTSRIFEKDENIMITIGEWLELSDINLDDMNYGVKKTEEGELIIPGNDYPRYRMTGLEIILKVNFYNVKTFSNFDDTTCIIQIVTNKGWASKGSKLNYITYPDLFEGSANEKNIYIDRYRYGIKFKFIVSGLMGEFNLYMLITHLVSVVVLTGVARTVLSYVVMYLMKEKSTLFKQYRVKTVNSGDKKLIKRKKSKMILNHINELNNSSNIDNNERKLNSEDDNKYGNKDDSDSELEELHDLDYNINFSTLKRQFGLKY